LAGRVQVSLYTAQLLAPGYRLTKRGSIDVKGVGEMDAFWLEGRR
jgi:hypothetical protein